MCNRFDCNSGTILFVPNFHYGVLPAWAKIRVPRLPVSGSDDWVQNVEGIRIQASLRDAAVSVGGFSVD